MKLHVECRLIDNISNCGNVDEKGCSQNKAQKDSMSNSKNCEKGLKFKCKGFLAFTILIKPTY